MTRTSNTPKWNLSESTATEQLPPSLLVSHLPFLRGKLVPLVPRQVATPSFGDWRPEEAASDSLGDGRPGRGGTRRDGEGRRDAVDGEDGRDLLEQEKFFQSQWEGLS